MKKFIRFSLGALLIAGLTSPIPSSALEKESKLDYNFYQGGYHANQWGYFAIQADKVPAEVDGNGVLVAVVDTGIDGTHPDLYGRVGPGFNFISNKPIAKDTNSDDQGHGTHVSGIIGAGGLTGGLRGVAPGVTFMPVKVLSAEGNGSDQGVALGVRFAVDNGADVINLSLGGSTDPFDKTTSFTCEAINYAFSKNVGVIVASGNDGSYTNNLSDLAKCKGSFNVGAVGQELKRSYFSNFDATVSIVAPGSDILSDLPSTAVIPMASWNGTSMATPFVTGAYALKKSQKKSDLPSGIYKELTNSALDLGAKGVDPEYGAGMLDLNSLFNNKKTSQASIKQIITLHGEPHITSFKVYDTYSSFQIGAPLGVKVKSLSLAVLNGGFTKFRSSDVKCDDKLTTVYSYMESNPNGKLITKEQYLKDLGEERSMSSTPSELTTLIENGVQTQCSGSDYNLFLSSAYYPYSDSESGAVGLKNYSFSKVAGSYKINSRLSLGSYAVLTVVDSKNNIYRSLPFNDFEDKKTIVPTPKNDIKTLRASWTTEGLKITYTSSIPGPVRLMLNDSAGKFFKYITIEGSPYIFSTTESPEIRSHYLTLTISSDSSSKTIAVSPEYYFDYQVVTAGPDNITVKGVSTRCYEAKVGCAGESIELVSKSGEVLATTIILDNLSYFFNLTGINSLQAYINVNNKKSSLINWSRQ